MKIKLSDLNSNPFKKEINKGKLDEEQIKKIQANIKELGLMGSLPIFKKDNEYYLINGHHRKEALKRSFGKDFEVECTLHNYNEEQVLRGMIIENLTQRANEFKEEQQNVTAIENHLNKNPNILSTLRTSRKVNNDRLETEHKNKAVARDISFWIDEGTGKVISHDKITNLINIRDNLDEELLDKVEKHSHATGEKEDEVIGVKDAIALSKFEDKKEQKDLAKALLKSREQHGNKKSLNITKYKEATEEVKKKVRKGEIDIADISMPPTAKIVNNPVNDLKSLFINFGVSLDRFNLEKLKINDTENEHLQRAIMIVMKKQVVPFLKDLYKSQGKLIFEIA